MVPHPAEMKMELNRPAGVGPFPDAEARHVLEGFDPADFRFEDLFKEYRHTVFQLAFRMLGNHDDALELTQDVFEQVYKGLNSFRGDASPKTWICKITVNLVRNKIRWRRVRRIFNVRVFSEMPAHSLLNLEQVSERDDSPDGILLGSEADELVHDLLQMLPVKLRTVLVLKDVEGMGYGEIARSVGLSEGTVKSRVSRARERMRDLMLQGRGGNDEMS